QPRVEVRPLDLCEERLGGHYRYQVGVERTAVYGSARWRHRAHHFARATERTEGRAATQRLAETGQVGDDAIIALRTSCPGAKAGEDLIKDQHHRILARQFADRLEIARGRQQRAGVIVDGLHDDGRDLVTMLPQGTLQDLLVVPGSTMTNSVNSGGM